MNDLDDDEEIVTTCTHRENGGACAACFLESVRDLQLEQERATREVFENWEKDQIAAILKPHCERS